MIKYSEFDLYPGSSEIRAYISSPDNPRRVMCLVHGIGEHFGRYGEMIETLNKNGTAVTGIDLRGHGKSAGKRGDCAPRQKVLEDLDALLDFTAESFAGLPLILYGHSLGGNIVLDYRRRGAKSMLPDAFILSAPWIFLNRDFAQSTYRLASLVSGLPFTATIKLPCNGKTAGKRKRAIKYRRDPLGHSRISVRCAVESYEIGLALSRNRRSCHHPEVLQKPFLLMHGTSDLICSIEGSRRLAGFEKCRYVEFENHFHEIHNGGKNCNGQDVLEEMVAFLESI